ncbi:GlsB/YeaQ/YmgE family stress response membrane protein [Granulicella sp. WH15]|uniref:GlsB/YeaQ/YmgE family stress response membrane protein n=1 Tax=Granulicella sp. WH15 TaxID=2602070 RepID=UPI0013675DE1|nr:GlsB/YeaQ/YmgE family stress response membrane protein [Granulicella sp. WH15]QHN04074.1 GlsB/YeaQ/YmgE family stress response membrane protein [Granulicella sp. WH15]
MPHGIIMTIVIGFIVGLIAKLIMPGREPSGFIITSVIGIAGSFLGTYLGRAIGHYEPGQYAGFLMSLLGACILLGIYHLITRGSSRT